MKPFIIVNGILVESTYNFIALQLKKYEMKWQNDLKARKCTIQFTSIVVGKFFLLKIHNPSK